MPLRNPSSAVQQRQHLAPLFLVGFVVEPEEEAMYEVQVEPAPSSIETLRETGLAAVMLFVSFVAAIASGDVTPFTMEEWWLAVKGGYDAKPEEQ